MSSDTPFQILVMGDFGSDRLWGKPISVDRDNLEEVMERLQVNARVVVDDSLPHLEIPARELDDFHPDRLYEQLEVFSALRERRKRLQNNDSFRAEADLILANDPTIETPPQAAPAAESSEPPATDVLDQMVSQTEAARKPIVQQIAEGSLNIDDLVRRIVAPFVLQKADPRQAEFIAGVDQAISATMKLILHHASFQETEAAWLGLKMLVRRLETDASLKISIVNIPRAQLNQDVCGSDDLPGTQLHRLLVDEPSVTGATRWSVVAGNYTFDESETDTDVLGRVARICEAAGTPFIAAAASSITGCSDLTASADPEDWAAVPPDAAERWQALRSLSESRRVALAMPRILGRRIYGEDTDPIDSFRFEELENGSEHTDYLWINPAFAAVTLLGQSFSAGGWSLGSCWSPEFDGLPVHVYDDDGESTVKPCGEVELYLRTGEVLSGFGLTAVHSVRSEGAVLIPRIQSIALADNELAAPWN